MSENLHDIDKLFHDAIEEHTEIPSPDVWNNLDKGLDRININTIQKKYRRLKRIAILLLLLLTTAVLYELKSKHSSKGKSESDITNSSDAPTNASQIIPSKNTAIIPQPSISSTVKKDSPAIINSTNNIPTNDPAAKIPSPSNVKRSQKPQPITALNNNKDERNNEGGKEDLYKKPVTVLKSQQRTKINIINPGLVNDPENNTAETPANAGFLNSWLSPSTIQVEKLNVENTRRQHDLVIKDKEPITETASHTGTGKSSSAHIGRHFHFSAGISLTRLFSSNRIEDDHKDGRHNDRNAIKENEQKQTAYSLGLTLEIPFAKKWGLQSGVALLNKKTDIAPQKIYAKLDNNGQVKYQFNCSSGYSYITPKAGTAPAVGDSINISSSTNNLKYITIPLSVKYNFNIGKFSIGPIIGASVNILAKQKTETGVNNGNSFDKQTINNIEGLKHSYFNGFGGVSLDYNLTKKIAVNLTPAGNVALSSINKNSSVKSYPNALGVSAGVKIKF